jgi:hypothetical protein
MSVFPKARDSMLYGAVKVHQSYHHAPTGLDYRDDNTSGGAASGTARCSLKEARPLARVVLIIVIVRAAVQLAPSHGERYLAQGQEPGPHGGQGPRAGEPRVLREDELREGQPSGHGVDRRRLRQAHHHHRLALD